MLVNYGRDEEVVQASRHRQAERGEGAEEDEEEEVLMGARGL